MSLLRTPDTLRPWVSSSGRPSVLGFSSREFSLGPFGRSVPLHRPCERRTRSRDFSPRLFSFSELLKMVTVGVHPSSKFRRCGCFTWRFTRRAQDRFRPCFGDVPRWEPTDSQGTYVYTKVLCLRGVRGPSAGGTHSVVFVGLHVSLSSVTFITLLGSVSYVITADCINVFILSHDFTLFPCSTIVFTLC